MKTLLIASTALFYATSAIAQQDKAIRTVEATGIAIMHVKADQLFIEVGVNAGEACEIPRGKNYAKYIKECSENNKKLMATRENIMMGLIASYQDRVKLVEQKESKYQYEGAGSSFSLLFTSFEAYQDFKANVKEYKDAFTLGEVTAMYSKWNDSLRQSLFLQSLTNARQRADAMATTLGASIDKVYNIYEANNNDQMSGYMKQVMNMYGTNNAWSRKLGADAGMFNLQPDDQGYIDLSETSYVRFLLK
jgi:hypothetical protein